MENKDREFILDFIESLVLYTVGRKSEVLVPLRKHNTSVSVLINDRGLVIKYCPHEGAALNSLSSITKESNV